MGQLSRSQLLCAQNKQDWARLHGHELHLMAASTDVRIRPGAWQKVALLRQVSLLPLVHPVKSRLSEFALWSPRLASRQHYALRQSVSSLHASVPCQDLLALVVLVGQLAVRASVYQPARLLDLMLPSLAQALRNVPRERAEWIVWIDMDVVLGDIGFTFPLTKEAYQGKDLIVWGNYDAVLAGDTYNGAHTAEQQSRALSYQQCRHSLCCASCRPIHAACTLTSLGVLPGIEACGAQG